MARTMIDKTLKVRRQMKERERESENMENIKGPKNVCKRWGTKDKKQKSDARTFRKVGQGALH